MKCLLPNSRFFPKRVSINWTAGILLTFAFLAATANAAPGRATASGVVNDSGGKPVADATVLVYSAGVRTGYSVFCPTCYADCGKKALTDSEGRFIIPGLDDDLVFSLLVVKDGYAPKWIKPVDPLKGAISPAAIEARAPVDDPQRLVRGKVTDGSGVVPYALVQVVGASYVQDGVKHTMYGQFSRDDAPLAVANQQGEFELPFSRPATSLILRLSARAKAPLLLTTDTGVERRTITMTDGATVHGRLLKDGKPLAGVELGMTTLSRTSGSTHPEERVSTDEKGRFAFTNVPPARVWNLYAKMESLAGRGAMVPIQCATERDGQNVDVGDIRLQNGVTLSGKVELSDGKPVPGGMRVLIGSTGWDSQDVPLAADGSFVARGLMPGAYTLFTTVKGYRVPDGSYNEVLVQRDVRNYVLRLEPDAQTRN